MLVDIVCSYVLKAAYPETYDQVWGIQEQSKRCINMSVCMYIYIYIYIFLGRSEKISLNSHSSISK